MKVFLYRLVQCTWGILQTLLGLVVFLINRKEKHFSYHGAIITEWNSRSSVSLGLFVFVRKEPYECDSKEKQLEMAERLLVHEYGHTIQSLLLGPLYLIVIGIPSSTWAGTPYFVKMRKEKRISYFSFYTESWADSWGEKVTKRKAMGKEIID